MSSKVALIDGDIIVYSVGFAADTDPLPNALHSVKIMINSMIEAVHADSFRVFLTGSGNYRTELATILPYKGTRKAAKPTHYNEIRRYLVDVWDAEVIDGMEADDAMGIAQTSAEPHTTIICSIDKDMDMISGLHYNWRKKLGYEVSQSSADLWFMKQLIMGDRTDNIRGIDGFGDKKAQRIINECDNISDLYWKVLELYSMQHDRPYEAMMENANLLWIQRKEGALWDSNIAELANE